MLAHTQTNRTENNSLLRCLAGARGNKYITVFLSALRPSLALKHVVLCNSLFTPPTRTRQNSSLVCVGRVNTIGDKTRQFCLVSTQFPICSCSVSNILRTTENLKIGNWVETRQHCLVLSPIVFTPPTRTKQDSFVLCVSAVWTSFKWLQQLSYPNVNIRTTVKQASNHRLMASVTRPVQQCQTLQISSKCSVSSDKHVFSLRG